MQALAAQYGLVIVTPDGDPGGWYVDSARVEGANIQSYLLKELVPDVDHRLPVSSYRAVSGLSMGGNGAIALALKQPGTFHAVSSLSGVVELATVQDRPPSSTGSAPTTRTGRSGRASRPANCSRFNPAPCSTCTCS